MFTLYTQWDGMGPRACRRQGTRRRAECYKVGEVGAGLGWAE